MCDNEGCEAIAQKVPVTGNNKEGAQTREAMVVSKWWMRRETAVCYTSIMKGSGLVALLVALGAIGCAARQVQLHDLVKAGYQNEILASEEYKGERLAVSGVVEDRGLRSRQQFEASFSSIGVGSHSGPTFTSGEATGEWVNKKEPYVMLLSNGEFNARLLCRFDNSLRKDVGLLSPGESVTLDGDFSGYRKTSQGKIAVLRNCDIVSTESSNLDE